MKIAVVGTGYVGLVTGVALSEVGHQVICIDTNETKIKKMKRGIPSIYEPELAELMKKNMLDGKLTFTMSHEQAFKEVDVIYIAVGTPENGDGSANLSYIENVAETIALTVTNDVIVATKSTVPVGTNDQLQELINLRKLKHITIEVVSNPEFLREGSAIYDSFHGDRIVIGANSDKAANIMKEINQPFGIPIYKTDRRSAEMIKYASNAFLATKISFINEIANICERVNADIEQVAMGMGLDKRIGPEFLKAGIGYGGSCFPKDTKALIQIAGNVEYDFELLKGVVNVNKKQQQKVLTILYEKLGDVKNKKIAVLGLAFKPNTDDMREAPSLSVINDLIKSGSYVYAYDPIAGENAKKLTPPSTIYVKEIEQAVEQADAALILTEWQEIINMDLTIFNQMNYPLIIDGRNCFSLNDIAAFNYEYYSVGRRALKPHFQTSLEGW